MWGRGGSHAQGSAPRPSPLDLQARICLRLGREWRRATPEPHGPSTLTAHAHGRRVPENRTQGPLPRPGSPPAPPRGSRWSLRPFAWTAPPGHPGRLSHWSASHRLWGPMGMTRAQDLSQATGPAAGVRHGHPTWLGRGRKASVSRRGPSSLSSPVLPGTPPFSGAGAGSFSHVPLQRPGALYPAPPAPGECEGADQ